MNVRVLLRYEWTDSVQTWFAESLFISEYKSVNRMKYVNSNRLKIQSVTMTFGICVHGRFLSIRHSSCPGSPCTKVHSGLEIVAVSIDAFLQPVSPAFSHGMSEFSSGYQSDFLVDALLQLCQILEHNSSQILLEAGKKEKIGGREVRVIRGMRENVCSPLLKIVDHWICTMGGCPIMVKPKGVVPPAGGASSANALSEGLHNLQVVLCVHPPSLGYKFVVDDTLGIPEHH